MAFYYYGTDQTAAAGATVFKILGYGDVVTVARDATIYVPDGAGFLLGQANRFSLYGQIVTYERGIYGYEDATDADVRIYAGAAISSAYSAAISIGGDDARVFNAGMLEGRYGVFLDGANAQLNNEGTIVASDDAVTLGSSDNGGARLLNSGTITSTGGDAVTIRSDGNAIIANSGTISSTAPADAFGNEYGGIFAYYAVDALDLTNSGTISGIGYSVAATFGEDVVRNSGTLVGDVLLRGGDDVYDGTGGTVLGIVDGSYGDDVLGGGAGRDVLDGGDGDDVIDGGAGIDRLIGGYGADQIDGGDGADLIDGGDGEDRIDGGAGRDTVFFRNQVTLDLADTTQSTGDALGDSYVSIEAFRGSEENDILRGASGDERLDGRGGNDLIGGRDGNDTLVGGDGDDVLAGGAGNDRLLGGYGSDTASYFDATAGVKVGLDIAGRQDTGGAGRDVLESIENLIGSGFADQLTGDFQSNRIDGGNGNDIVNGGDGNDRLMASLGDDRMVGGNGIDTADYSVVAGPITIDLTLATAQNTGASGSDTLLQIENVIGTALGDTITGSTLANAIDGGAGNDRLDGGSGDDVLTGGFGDDMLIGGLGSDTADYSGAASRVVVKLALTTQQNTLGGGLDTLSGIENVTGSAYDDELTGDGGNNSFEGGAGNDTINGGAGTDTATYRTATAAVTVDLLITTVQDTGGAGIDKLSLIEGLVGSDYADTLYGTNGANRIDGGGNSDTIYGRDGNDILSGGGGFSFGGDTLYGGNGNDILSGGLGSDVLDGGADFDTASFAGDDYGITVDFRGPSGTAGTTLDAYSESDMLISIEAVIGTGGEDLFFENVDVRTYTGGLGADGWSFTAGTAQGDTITDFSAAQGDYIYFHGYAAGATFVKVDATHWGVNVGGTISDVITFSNAPTFDVAAQVIFAG